MDVTTWFQIAGAAAFGALAAAAFVYALGQVQRREREGKDPFRLPFPQMLMYLLPLALIGWAAWSLTLG
jgi:hypothetical protein